jgi:hypothetical protein
MDYDSGLVEAREWARQYMPRGQEAVYEIAAKYAEQQYESMIKLSELLDRKADELARFMITLVAAVVAAISARIMSIHHPWTAVGALILVFFAVHVLMRARTPTAGSTPLDPRDLLAVIDLDIDPRPSESQIYGVLAVSYHVAVLGMRSLTTWKSRMLQRATLLFLAAFALLLLAITPFNGP